MSSFPGTLLLLHHIKELETGKRYSHIDLRNTAFLPPPPPHGILDWGSFWGLELFPNIKWRPTSLPVHPAGWLWLLTSGNFKISLRIQEPFSVPSHHLLQKLRRYKMSQCWDGFCSSYSMCPRELQMVQDKACAGQSISDSGFRPLGPDTIWVTSKIDTINLRSK